MRNPDELTLACQRAAREKCEQRGRGKRGQRVGWTPGGFGHPCTRGASVSAQLQNSYHLSNCK